MNQDNFIHKTGEAIANASGGAGDSAVASFKGVLKHPPPDEIPASTSGDANFQALKTYGRDLVEQAGKLDPVIGWDEEIRSVLCILSRRTDNNAVLIGEARVGRTAVVEGLAQRIATGNVPRNLACVRLFSLDMDALIAGVKYMGEFEERLKVVFKEVEYAAGKVVLFIDEIHRVFGGGRMEGSMDADYLFELFFAKRQLRCIGATTLKEYKKYFEKHAIFERRFQQVYVVEPSVADTISILCGLKKRYEVHHLVRIQHEALVVAAELSARYINGCHLPDKAIDLVDEACANVRIQHDRQLKETANMESIRIQLEVEMDAIEKEKDKANKSRHINVRKELDDFWNKLQHLEIIYKMENERIDKLRRAKLKREELLSVLQEAKSRMDSGHVVVLQCEALQEIDAVIAQLEVETSGENIILLGNVGPDQIAEVVSRWTGIPVIRFSQNKKERLIGLAERLRKRVVGQDEAVDVVANVVFRSRAIFDWPQQPTNSFLFLGPIGVGKTELAKALAEQLFDDESLIVRIDMSMYMEEHSVAQLIGAPPAYVGYEEGGQLTEAVRRRPMSVVLFDEVEKAHSSVFNKLLKVLDDGRLTDGRGMTVDFSNTVIIMSSNLGAEHLLAGMLSNSSMKMAKECVMKEVRRHFRPELLSRLDGIVLFDPLSHDQLKKVARLQMKNVAVRLAKRGIALGVTDAALDVVLSESYEPKFGARSIRRWLQKIVVTELSKMLLREEIDKNSTVYVDVVPGKKELSYRVEKNGGMVNAFTSDILLDVPDTMSVSDGDARVVK